MGAKGNKNKNKEIKIKKVPVKGESESPSPHTQPMKKSGKGKQAEDGGDVLMKPELSLLDKVAVVPTVALENTESKGGEDDVAETRRKLAQRLQRLRETYPAIIDVSDLGSLIVKNEDGKFLDFEKLMCGFEKSLGDVFHDDNTVTTVSEAQEGKILSITRGEVPLKGKQREKAELELLEILAAKTKSSFVASDTPGEVKRGRRRNHAGHPGGPVASTHEYHRFPGRGTPYMPDPYFYGGGYKTHGGNPYYYGGFGGYGAFGGGPGRPRGSGRGRGGRDRGGTSG